LEFSLQHTDAATSARTGVLTTDHGIIETPFFMPVGTLGAVKAVGQRELREEVGASILLSNTYHLYLRPGTDVLQKAGGLHRFNRWDGPILTDSGGYQIFSLAAQRKLSEAGATFRSHIDGSTHEFTPENVMDIQRKIGADIIMAFDECPPYPCERSYAADSMELTHRWLARCVKRFGETDPLYGYSQALFPIVQGSVFRDLRIRSAEFISSMDCAGNAIGGLSVGEPAEDMYEMTETVTAVLPKHKPRYLMGVGTPANILECIALGIDMFDCVLPTRNARHGLLFTTQGIISIRNEKWKNDHSPIDPAGHTGASQYTKSFLRHLLVSGEILAAQIASMNNLGLYIWLMKESRKHIVEGTFRDWKEKMAIKLMQRL
jgi:queuine tRNA-ribosyltransferase